MKCHKPKKKVDVENLNLHNTMLQREYVNDNLHNNATTRHHEEDIDSEMQAKNWEFEFVNERAKILKTNKHKI